MLAILRSPLADRAAKIVDTRLPSHYPRDDTARAVMLSETISARLAARFRPEDVQRHLPELERIVASLPMRGAVQIMQAMETVHPGSCHQMAAVRSHVNLLETLARLAEMFRADRLTLIARALRARVRKDSDV